MHPRRIGLILGPFIFLIMILIPSPEGLSQEGWYTAAITLWVSIWWISEPIPIPVTSLLPIILFPLMQVGSVQENAAPYAHPMIFLFMGGFLIALGMQRWNLHQRFALNIVKRIGTKPLNIIAGFMLASAILSSWISNTAATLMMLPVALSVVDLIPASSDSKDGKNFSTALLLGLAYAASIGGLGTLIGTPTNTLLAGYVEREYGFEISFVQWMMVGIPFVFLTLPLAYLVLTKFAFPIRVQEIPGGKDLIYNELDKIGSITRPEKTVAIIFSLTAFLWIFRPLIQDYLLPGLSDTGIALFGAMLLFAIPSGAGGGDKVMNWEWGRKLPWGVLLLFGGGLSLAAAISRTGLAGWIGSSLSTLSFLPLIVLIALAVLLVIFMTELASNSATAAAFLPILGAVAVSGLAQNPLLLIVPATIAASCAFMLPAATPPNAIVYGSERIRIQEMVRGGFLLNILYIILVTAAVYALVLPVFGIELGVLPDWAL